MKTSISLFLSDILPQRRKFFHKIVKNKIFKEHTPSEAFTYLRHIGLDGFELLLPQYITVTDEDILQVKKLSQLYKFPVLSVHQSLRFFTTTKINEITRVCEVAEMLSAKVVVLHINSAGKQIFNNTYIQAIHALEKKYKVKIAFENMEKHALSYFSSHRWHETHFSDIVKKEDFYITFDIVHLAHSGGDILRFFENNKGKIVNIHLSDYRKHPLNSNLRPLRYKHMCLGDGELPIEAFIHLLKKEKYNGLLTLELHSDIKGVEKSISLVNQYLDTSNTTYKL